MNLNPHNGFLSRKPPPPQGGGECHYQRAGGPFGNRLVTWHVILLRRMGGTSMDAPVYRLDDTATGLNIGQ